MAILSDLPEEILDMVFMHLSGIDDVHNLGRACTAAYHVIQPSSNYKKIMRCVVGRAPEHRFDISLCMMLDLHCNIVRHFTDGHGPLVATQPGSICHDTEVSLVNAVTFECPKGPCTECLPDDRVHEILARYQGLRILEKEWLARELSDTDVLPIEYDTREADYLKAYGMFIQLFCIDLMALL